MRLETWSIHGSGFHFGVHGLGEEETAIAFPSDSLFAALAARLAEIEGPEAVERFAAPFLEGDPPWALTSTFPFAGKVRFFPPPLSRLHAEEGPPAATAAPSEAPHKVLKKVRFVSEAIFRRLIAGTPLKEIYPSAHKLQSRSLLLDSNEAALLPPGLADERERIWEVERRPRVTVERATDRASIFHSGRVSFADGCGLWFGVHRAPADGDSREQPAALLEELAAAGLGGNRSAGFGAARIAPAAELDLPDAAGRPWVSLSRYLPREDEIMALVDPRAAYTLHSVGGWLESPARRGLRRLAVNLLGEGSVFGPLPRLIPGRIADVRPRFPTDPDPLGHAVYRSGLAVAVGLKGALE